MKIENKDNYVILADEYNKINDFVSFLDYQIPTKFKGQNTKHRATKQSFVIVTNTVNPDDIPEELFVVPTLQEAEDIIEMEEIERDLGF